MGRLIKNHWARLIILSAAGWQVGASIEGFFWPKVFWDFITHNLDAAVKPVPILQIINLILGIAALAWEWPLKPLAGTPPHRSIELRLLLYPLSALACALMYQSGDVAIYYLIEFARNKTCEAKKMAKRILYILVSSGQGATTEQVHRWFANAKTLIPGLLAATTYSALDEQKPEHLVVYEFSDSSDINLAQILKNAESKNFDSVELRVYTLYSEKTSPKHTHANVAGDNGERVFRTLALQPGPNLPVQDYNDWYEQEHIPLLSVVPGWLKSTRWVLKEAASSSHAKGQEEKKLSHFLAIHEWESMASFKTEEFMQATNTPWRNRIIPKIDKTLEERRNFGKGREI
ncbi:hypothetical protein DPV78_011478 [Talaromyces pinophilus]|nr:hypothetical protein DPV78_011478 [Talaromyces pinophilus]